MSFAVDFLRSFFCFFFLLNRHKISEIFLKVALNTIKQTHFTSIIDMVTIFAYLITLKDA